MGSSREGGRKWGGGGVSRVREGREKDSEMQELYY